MKTLFTYLFTISFLLGFGNFAFAQENNQIKKTSPQKDSVTFKDKYGIRFGVDIAKPVRSLLDKDYTGFELVGDYRLYKRIYVAAEIGNEDYSYTEPYIDANTKGSYVKIGANYNTYHNWLDMQNEIYAGIRYGFSSFTQTLNRYKVYTTDGYFEQEIRSPQTEFSGLTQHWVELQIGLKTEVLNNLFLGIHAQIKRSFGGSSPSNFANLYVPGFHRTYEGSDFGVGWGYSISYLIPIFKKEQKVKTPEKME
ncbi:DUF6048 family protein [Mesonia aquimarina]|uniref:DUF6048 family protein n=1 Tax=Mesonia aquimarina TaxID=1504967 RepID=UPI000EF5EF97|nr:DUF6048 family protein [Mesonia aquimarina]